MIPIFPSSSMKVGIPASSARNFLSFDPLTGLGLSALSLVKSSLCLNAALSSMVILASTAINDPSDVKTSGLTSTSVASYFFSIEKIDWIILAKESIARPLRPTPLATRLAI